VGFEAFWDAERPFIELADDRDTTTTTRATNNEEEVRALLACVRDELLDLVEREDVGINPDGERHWAMTEDEARALNFKVLIPMPKEHPGALR
jgi:hypothetical protein